MQNVVTALGIYPFAVNQFNKLCQFPALQPSEWHPPPPPPPPLSISKCAWTASKTAKQESAKKK